MAERLGGTKLSVSGLTNADLEPRQTALMGLLQYMVGNTDFSFTARHNLEFVNRRGVIYPIIFDYDQAGVINAAYAIPDPSLGTRKVTERVYRGLCVPVDTLMSVLEELKAKRPQIEALYRDELGKLMGGMMASSAQRFLKGFYSEIENPRNVERYIVQQCAAAR